MLGRNIHFSFNAIECCQFPRRHIATSWWVRITRGEWGVVMSVVQCTTGTLCEISTALYSPASSRSRTLSVFNSFTQFVESQFYICPSIQRNSSFASTFLRTSYNQNSFHICKSCTARLEVSSTIVFWERSMMYILNIRGQHWFWESQVRRSGRPQPQARSSVSTWTTQWGAGIRWFSQCWHAPDFRDYSNRRDWPASWLLMWRPG